jgi:signal transduction histidine kinase/DNA-binding response OmpR family regulator/HPt (histidine-containing phosphotransfer) domain-containing protein
LLHSLLDAFQTTGLGEPYQGEFDPALVTLSIVIAIVAAFVALSVSSRIAAATSAWGRWAWTGAGAFSMGGGIWGMHFIGMLAFSLPCGATYNPLGTVVSMVPGILASGVALRLIGARREPGLTRLSVGAVLMGAGIGAMHYTGMDALQTEALLHYDFPLVVVSVIVAVALAFVSLAIRFYLRRYLMSDTVATLVAAPAMGLAVACMHYTAMKAAVFLPPTDALQIGFVLPTTLMASLIAIISLLVAAIALAGSVAGRQSELAAGLRAEVAERRRAEAELVHAREQAEAANLAKSQFLATMSHEIRTPMNGVLGMANLLSSTALNDRQQRLVDNVSRSGQALLGIISDILDFAKIESGKFELSSVAFEPREAIGEMAELFCERCSAKGLEFIYFVAEDVPPIVVGDPLRLRQILVNLVGNAVKFTERGEILVEASLVQKDADGIVLHFAVRDTGIGIPADELARIFESFHQVDASLTRTRGGSGLGLAITRQLVELMGGEIAVESETGKGSCFSFTVPFKRSSLAGDCPRPPWHLPRPLRTLLADANAVSAHVTSLYLASWQIDATIVKTLDEAKAAQLEARQAGKPFDVAIVDLKGFGAEAVDFAALARSSEGDHRCEIILLTALDMFTVGDSLEHLDAAAILPKPARPSELFSALVSISHGRKPGRQAPKRRDLRAGLPNFGARILIAEDNPVNQEVAAGILELMGCSAVSAPNGSVAVRLFAEEKFDAVLMDCEMPVMDGIEATVRIREIEAMMRNLPDGEPARPPIPIIASTAHAINEVREKCMAAGMDDFLIKPFDERQVAETLLRWLKPRAVSADDQPAPEPIARLAPSKPPAPAAEDEVIDTAVISGLQALTRPGRPSPLARALPRFLETAPNAVATIREHFEAGDAEALWRAAHSLKSSAGALGAKRLSRHCAEIETRARESGVDAARPLIGSLENDLTAAISGLRAAAEPLHEPA